MMRWASALAKSDDQSQQLQSDLKVRHGQAERHAGRAYQRAQAVEGCGRRL